MPNSGRKMKGGGGVGDAGQGGPADGLGCITGLLG
jgi:hypothetical protein